MNRHINYLWLIGFLFMTSCCFINKNQEGKDTPQMPSRPILTGWLTQQQLFDQVKPYQSGKNQYQPEAEPLKKIKSLSNDIQIMVFLGTWCSDSQREVPRFLKVMELAQNPHINYKLMGLDRSKRDADGFAEQYQIEFVPTFVVIHNDEEIGRIVETPIASIEQDLAEIIAPLK